MNTNFNEILIGSSEETLILTGDALHTTICLDYSIMEKVQQSLMNISAMNSKNKIYLTIENVRGNINANTLTVSVNQQPAGNFALYGLRNASRKGKHGNGTGLTFPLDITSIISNIYLEDTIPLTSLDISVVLEHSIFNQSQITIEKISLYSIQ